MKEPKYQVGDRVHFSTPAGSRSRCGTAKIVDIENDVLYNEPRYGLEVEGFNPFIMSTPYLWEKELTLIEDNS